MHHLPISLRLALVAVAAGAAWLGSAPALPAAQASCSAGDRVCQQLVAAQAGAQRNQTNLAAIRQQIGSAEARMALLANLLVQLDGEVAKSNDRVRRTQTELVALDGRIAATKRELVLRQSQLRRRQVLFDQRVRALDQAGQVDYLVFLLGASSFTELLQRAAEADAIVQGDHAYVEGLRWARAQVASREAQLEAEQAQASRLLAAEQAQELSLAQQTAQLQAAQAYQQQLETAYQARAAALVRQQAQTTSDIRRLTAEYQAELAAIAARARQRSHAGGPPGGGAAQFQWPEASHLVTQGFGCTDLAFEMYWPSCSSRHFHTGIDIAGPDGSPVWAASAGILTEFATDYGYGNYEVIVSPGGYSTLYGHLSAFAAPSGAVVAAGQVIGYEGSTGWSTGPHLHFEIRYNGVWQDPCSYLSC